MKLYYSAIKSSFEPISNYISIKNINNELEDNKYERNSLEGHLYYFYFSPESLYFDVNKLFKENFLILSVDTETKEYEWLTINDEIVKKALIKCKKRALLL